MTHTEYAGARLANAVTLWLRDRDATALAGVKLALSEYREAEQRPVTHFDRGDGRAACGGDGPLSRTLSDDACPRCLDVMQHEYGEARHD